MIGFYLPLERDEDEVPRAVAKLGASVEQVLEESAPPSTSWQLYWTYGARTFPRTAEHELAALLDLRGAHVPAHRRAREDARIRKESNGVSSTQVDARRFRH